jgi:hypothetical protein
MSLDKPPIGAPCNRCGLCCKLQVCGAGSFALGLVENYGDRKAGPCPALLADGEGFVCGLITRPKQFLPEATARVMALRSAFTILVGADTGCDEQGDEPDETAIPKLRQGVEEFAKRYPQDKLIQAAEIAYAHRFGR